MKCVREAFAKNFDKFELYVLRNVLVTPDNLLQLQDNYKNSRTKSIFTSNNTAEVVSSETGAIQLVKELEGLRQEIRIEIDKQRALHQAQAELDQQLQHVKSLASKLEFTTRFQETGSSGYTYV